MKKIVFYLLIINLLAYTSIYANTAHTGMRKISTLQITAEMAPGLNLCNTLEAIGNKAMGLASETAWGQPYTTKAMVTSFAERGFKTLRIPVTWFTHIGSYPNYMIDTAWMDRVEEVANYAFDNNMYVIIDIHHDDYQSGYKGSWLYPSYEMQDTVTNELVKVWTQIAERFKDYGDYLIFETMNEPRAVGAPEEWSGGSEEHREVVNAFNLAAVNAIRATSGNNETRFIMIPQVAANAWTAMKDLVIPNSDPNIIVSVHNYDPFGFCLDTNGPNTWGSTSDVSSLKNNLKAISDHFVAKGQAVVMGEWGAGNKDNYADRVNYYNIYTKACKEGGITPITWIYEFDRTNLSWTMPLIEDAILQVYDSTAVALEDMMLNVTSDTLYVGDTLQLKAKIVPDSATSQNVAWTSYNKAVATINSSGLITAKGKGKALIKAATIGKICNCNIVVIDTVVRLQFFIEAELFAKQSGIQVETCADENGGQDVGYIENGDWCTYTENIDSTGVYDLIARVATNTNGGKIEISTNNKVLGEVEVDGTKSNGWQDWFTTEPVQINLNKGKYDIKLTFNGGSGSLFNVNWFELNFNKPLANSSINTEEIKNLKIYPNPARGQLTIEPLEKDAQIMLYSIDGSLRLIIKAKEPEAHIDINDCAKGTYILKIVSDKHISTKKLVFE